MSADRDEAVGASRRGRPRGTSRQKRQSSGSEDPLLGDGRAADADELADGARRRATASSRRRSRGRAGRRGRRPSRPIFARQRATASAHPTRARSRRCAPSSPPAGPGRAAAVARARAAASTGKTCTFVMPGRARRRRACARTRRSSSAGKPTITSRRQVEVVERLEPAQIRRGRVAARHRAQDAVVARLQRDVQVPRDGRRLAQRGDELAVDVVDLDRGEAQAREPGRRCRPRGPGAAACSRPRGRGSSRG